MKKILNKTAFLTVMITLMLLSTVIMTSSCNAHEHEFGEWTAIK